MVRRIKEKAMTIITTAALVCSFSGTVYASGTGTGFIRVSETSQTEVIEVAADGSADAGGTAVPSDGSAGSGAASLGLTGGDGGADSLTSGNVAGGSSSTGGAAAQAGKPSTIIKTIRNLQYSVGGSSIVKNTNVAPTSKKPVANQQKTSQTGSTEQKNTASASTKTKKSTTTTTKKPGTTKTVSSTKSTSKRKSKKK